MKVCGCNYGQGVPPNFTFSAESNSFDVVIASLMPASMTFKPV